MEIFWYQRTTLNCFSSSHKELSQKLLQKALGSLFNSILNCLNIIEGVVEVPCKHGNRLMITKPLASCGRQKSKQDTYLQSREQKFCNDSIIPVIPIDWPTFSHSAIWMCQRDAGLLNTHSCSAAPQSRHPPGFEISASSAFSCRKKPISLYPSLYIINIY